MSIHAQYRFWEAAQLFSFAYAEPCMNQLGAATQKYSVRIINEFLLPWQSKPFSDPVRFWKALGFLDVPFNLRSHFSQASELAQGSAEMSSFSFPAREFCRNNYTCNWHLIAQAELVSFECVFWTKTSTLRNSIWQLQLQSSIILIATLSMLEICPNTSSVIECSKKSLWENKICTQGVFNASTSFFLQLKCICTDYSRIYKKAMIITVC